MPKMPETVDVLVGNDFCRGTLTRKRGESHCLLGWCNYMFESNSVREVSLVKKYKSGTSEYLLQKLLQAEWEIASEEDMSARTGMLRFGEINGCPIKGLAGNVAGFNDNNRVPKRILARVFNRFTAKLGYTEGNPEA